MVSKNLFLLTPSEPSICIYLELMILNLRFKELNLLQIFDIINVVWLTKVSLKS